MPDEKIGGAFVEIGGESSKLKKDLAMAEGMVANSMKNAAKLAGQFAGPLGKLFGAGGVVAAGIAEFSALEATETTQIRLLNMMATRGLATFKQYQQLKKEAVGFGNAIGESTQKAEQLMTVMAKRLGADEMRQAMRLTPGAMQFTGKPAEEVVPGIVDIIKGPTPAATATGMGLSGIRPKMPRSKIIQAMENTFGPLSAHFTELLDITLEGMLKRAKAATLDAKRTAEQWTFKQVFGGLNEEDLYARAQAGETLATGIGPTARAAGHQFPYQLTPEGRDINALEIDRARDQIKDRLSGRKGGMSEGASLMAPLFMQTPVGRKLAEMDRIRKQFAPGAGLTPEVAAQVVPSLNAGGATPQGVIGGATTISPTAHDPLAVPEYWEELLEEVKKVPKAIDSAWMGGMR